MRIWKMLEEYINSGNSRTNMKNLVVIIGKIIPKNIIQNEQLTKVYEFPETNLHPKEQIKWVKNLVNSDYVKNNNKLTIIIKTYSDFIIRELNYYIMKKIIDYNKISVVDSGIIKNSDILGIKTDSIDIIIDEQNDKLENIYYNTMKSIL